MEDLFKQANLLEESDPDKAIHFYQNIIKDCIFSKAYNFH